MPVVDICRLNLPTIAEREAQRTYPVFVSPAGSR
jgi:hypothetical protein